MREDNKIANIAVRPLTSDEMLAVSGGAKLKVPHPGGAIRQALGGGILGEVIGEALHTGRRVARDLPFQVF